MKQTITLFVLLVSAFVANAQKMNIDGYYVTLRGDTIKTTLRPNWAFGPNLYDSQFKIQVADSLGEKNFFKPGEIRSFTMHAKDSSYTFISMPFPAKKEGEYSIYFVHLVEEGPLTLFVTYRSINYTPTPTYFLWKKGISVTPVVPLSFKKDMVEYFSGCPEVATAIESRDLRLKDVPTIVRTFNKKCGR